MYALCAAGMVQLAKLGWKINLEGLEYGPNHHPSHSPWEWLSRSLLHDLISKHMPCGGNRPTIRSRRFCKLCRASLFFLPFSIRLSVSRTMRAVSVSFTCSRPSSSRRRFIMLPSSRYDRGRVHIWIRPRHRSALLGVTNELTTLALTGIVECFECPLSVGQVTST